MTTPASTSGVSFQFQGGGRLALRLVPAYPLDHRDARPYRRPPVVALYEGRPARQHPPWGAH